jgi:hypothetical protein
MTQGNCKYVPWDIHVSILQILAYQTWFRVIAKCESQYFHVPILKMLACQIWIRIIAKGFPNVQAYLLYECMMTPENVQ